MHCWRPDCRTQKWAVVFAVIAGLTVPARPGDFVAGGPCTRGRVHNNGVTIVSDWDTPLRGGCWCMDCHSGVFAREELVTAKLCGLNAIHVYAEKNDDKPVGYEAENIDSVVEWCRQESLYVVIVFGNSKLTNYSKVDQFWDFYAPRYADQTHVIYEPKNEGDNVAANAVRWHAQIRAVAPETHILFCSYSNLQQNIKYAMNDINKIGDGVDWSNASISYHGYGMSGSFQENLVKGLNDSGYCMTMTEFPFGTAGDVVRVFERLGMSYFWFEACWGGDRSLKDICRYINMGLSWQPDVGDWPQPHVERPVVESAREVRARGFVAGPAGVCRLMPLGFARGPVQSVYDLRGGLVWRAPGSAADNADGYAAGGSRRRPSQLYVVKYFAGGN